MRLHWEADPVVGQHFPFSVDRTVGVASIQISINNRAVFAFDCEDPPCHEAFFVPPGTVGSVMVLLARDDQDTERVEFVIRDLDAGRAMEYESSRA